jgi:hypothetical protein
MLDHVNFMHYILGVNVIGSIRAKMHYTPNNEISYGGILVDHEDSNYERSTKEQSNTVNPMKNLGYPRNSRRSNEMLSITVKLQGTVEGPMKC